VWNWIFHIKIESAFEQGANVYVRPNREVTGGSRIWHEEEVENFAFHTKTLE